MTERHFNEGLADGAAGKWDPPIVASKKDRLDYKEGWNQARADILVGTAVGERPTEEPNG